MDNKWLYIIYLLVHTLTYHATDAKKSDIRSLVTKKITKMARQYRIPGIAVALYAQEKPYLFHFGKADTTKPALVNEQTIFEIGSITKIFTTLLLALEVINKRMQLTDPISLYIPTLKCNPRVAPITLLQLATHTSKLSYDPPASATSQEQLLTFLQKWKSSSGQHTYWGYSNYGVELLRIALEHSNKLSIDELVKQRILLPLNMEPIGLAINSKYKSRYASCYGKNGKKTTYWDHPFMTGTAALRVTSKDMLNFLKALLGFAKIPTALQEAIRLSQSPFFYVNTSFSQGLIWQISPVKQAKRTFPLPRVNYKNNYREVHFECPATKLNIKKKVYDGELLYDKSGTTHGFHAYIAVIPSKKSGIVIMVNRRMERGQEILEKAGKAILNQW